MFAAPPTAGQVRNCGPESGPFRIYRQILSGVLQYSAGGIAVRALSIISVPLYLHFLTPADFGIQTIALLNESLLAMVAGYAVTNALGKHYMEAAQSGQNQGTLIGTAMAFLAGVGVVLLFLWEVFSTAVSQATLNTSSTSLLVTRLIGVSFFASLFFNLALAVWQLERQILLFFLSSFLRQATAIGVGVTLVVWFSAGVTGVVAGWVVASLATGLFSVIWLLKAYRLGFDAAVLRQLLSYGLPLLPAALLTLMLNGFDRFLLKQLASLDAVGRYSVAMTLAGCLNLALVAPFKQIWAPLMWKMRHQPDEAGVHCRTLTYYTVAQTAVLCAVTVFGDVGITMLTAGKSEFASAASVVPLVYLGMVLYGTYDILSAGYFFEAKTHFFTITVVASSACSVLLNLLLIPRLEIWGCSTAYAVSYLLFALLSYGFGRKFFKVEHDWTRLLKALAVGSVVCLAGVLARQLGGRSGTVSALVVLLSFPFLLWFVSFFEVAELRVLQALPARGRARLKTFLSI